jgi:predicted permease
VFTSLMQDLRYALRQLRKNPGFTAVAVFTLALGIGANTAIFSLLNAVLLRNLPIRQPEQLMLFGKGTWRGSMDGLPDRSWQLFSYPFFREFRQKNQVFSEVAAIDSIMFSTHGRVADGTNLEKINAELVSGTYFDTLGVRPVLGRVLTDADDRTPGGHPVVVASYSWWQRRFAKDGNVIGKSVTIRSTVYTVIGVAPAEFFGATVGQSPDLWIPLAMEKEISPGWNGLDENLFQSLYIIARRKPNVSAEQAGANTNLLFKQIIRQYAGAQPSQKQLDGIQRAEIALTPAAKGLSQLRHEFSSPLKILMAVVALVLLVACANVANLLLARASARQREVAVRMSMGARRLRLIRQLMVESTLLGATGAILGFWLAWGATQVLPRMVSAGSGPAPISVTPDIAVLGFSALVAVFTVLLFGTVPALSATRVELVPSLKEGRGTTSSRSRSRLARGLIVGQVALSLVLLAGAGLFLRTLVNLTNVDTGFNKQNVLTTSVDPDGAGYQEDARWNGVMDQIEERVNALPGIRAASFAFTLFNGGGWTDGVIVPGRPHQEHDPDVDHNMVGPRYFEAMGMPIVMGRSLLPEDVAKSRHVAVINETMARTFFGNESPVGYTFSIEGEPGTATKLSEWLNLEVVGVVKDAKYMDLDEKPMPAAFYPHSQHPGFLYTLIARYSGDPAVLAQAIGTTVHNIDPNLPVGEFSTLARLVDDSVLNHRLVAQLCTFFGVLASLLACIGIYGLMSYGVTRRTNEFGVRLALGAHRHHLVWLVLRETLALVLIGIALGLAAAPAIGRIVVSFLFGLKFYDPLSIGIAVLSMIAVALLAGYVPARRAAKVDPMIALRYE